MAQSYAVFYEQTGEFLLAWKLQTGYYFSDNGGAIVPKGKRLNGADNYALPGGRVEHRETILQAAAREFFEETGYQLRYTASQEQSFGPYGAGYFLAQPGDVATYVHYITTVSLPASVQIANAIRGRVIRSYGDIAGWVAQNGYTDWPRSNELAWVNSPNITDPSVWQMVQSWNHDPLDWYRTILTYLRHDILGIP
ncbi:MAG TPA: NUDIX domain-containing protein [Thermoanaerobaculia bacterium]|jgi:8-oxo-dGTP pyrophosphatase MutT (NUDIX family)